MAQPAVTAARVFETSDVKGLGGVMDYTWRAFGNFKNHKKRQAEEQADQPVIDSKLDFEELWAAGFCSDSERRSKKFRSINE